MLSIWGATFLFFSKLYARKTNSDYICQRRDFEDYDQPIVKRLCCCFLFAELSFFSFFSCREVKKVNTKTSKKPLNSSSVYSIFLQLFWPFLYRLKNIDYVKKWYSASWMQFKICKLKHWKTWTEQFRFHGNLKKFFFEKSQQYFKKWNRPLFRKAYRFKRKS